MSTPRVFIASSSNELQVALELGQQLKNSANTTVWKDGAFFPGQTIIESIGEIANRSDFAVFLLTATDTNDIYVPSNILFELGFFAGVLGLSRTFAVVDRAAADRLPSDLAGITYIPISIGKSGNISSAISPVVALLRKRMDQVGVRQNRASNEYHSCFISYSWQDQQFAARLHDDLQSVGIRSWLDAKEIETGVLIREAIDTAIQAHDKVLLVLSHASIRSSWVSLK